ESAQSVAGTAREGHAEVVKRLLRGLAAIAIAQTSASAAAPAPEPTPIFEVAIGGNGPIAGEDENAAMFPAGGAPVSFAVDADGSWWVLDAIASRVLVFERDGKLRRTIPFPLAGKDKRATFRSDFDLDGAGGV